MSEIRQRGSRISMNLPTIINEEPEHSSPKKIPKIILFTGVVFIVLPLFLKFCVDFMYYNHHNTELQNHARYRYKINCINTEIIKNTNFGEDCDIWGHVMEENIQVKSFIETLSGLNICKDADCGNRIMWTVLLILLTAFLTVIFMLWLGLNSMINNNRFNNDRNNNTSKVAPFVGNSA